MIVDFNLRGRNVLVIGGGAEAQKRIKALAGQQCSITVISGTTTPGIRRMAADAGIGIEGRNIHNLRLLARYKPDIIITTTNDHKLNQRIIAYAKRKKITIYSSDDPESSDYANLSVIDIGGAVQIAISTRGKSPAMAKKLKRRIEGGIRGMITDGDIAQIRIQDIARRAARDKIHGQARRKRFLAALLADRRIKRLIKDGALRKAEERAAAMSEKWG